MATLKDVAVRCGVDISTVSRALRGDERVKPETRDRVRDAAEALHYTPNLAARHLVSGKSRTIALIVSSLNVPMERLPAQYASTWLQERNYDLMISLTGRSEKTFERQVARLEQNLFDGAMIIPGTNLSPRAEKILHRLAQRNFPLVYLDRWDGMPSFPVVTSDNRTGGEGLARRLLARGCETILILSRQQNGVEEARVAGAVDACRERGVEPVILFPDDPFSGPVPVAGADKIGIIATHYGHVLSLMNDRASGLSDKCVLCGVFDEWPGSLYPASEVYVCEQDFEEMAFRACHLLLNYPKENKGTGERKIIVPLKNFRIQGE